MSTQVPFTTRGNTYQPTPETALLLKDIGGVEALTRMTTLFYEEAFRNPHIRVFFHHTEDPHAERLGTALSPPPRKPFFVVTILTLLSHGSCGDSQLGVRENGQL